MAQDQVFWYLNRPDAPCLRTNLETDVVIIGGGMAGLTTAQAFAKKNKSVVLLEAFYCGAGASGKSSGLITPNSELSLSDFINRYGNDGGKNIWAAIEGGVEHIRNTIQQHSIECDYIEEDALFVANSKSTVKYLIEEDENQKRLFNKTSFLTQEETRRLVGSDDYYAGILYKDNFGISSYKYCQALKEIIAKQGVQVFEETPVLDFKNHTVTTAHGIVKAKHIIVCTDRFTPHFGKLADEIYHGQNFLLMSQPLTPVEIKQIFPERPLMVWDTQMIYNYFRMSGDRLLLGGGSLLKFYNRYESHQSYYIHNKLTTYFKRQFPSLDLQFEQFWPGMIGISKDVAPLTGFDKDDRSIYYLCAAAGLPIAAALANYCADRLVDNRDDLKDYFSPYRKFAIPNWAHYILGKKLSFALSNFMSVRSQ